MQKTGGCRSHLLRVFAIVLCCGCPGRAPAAEPEVVPWSDTMDLSFVDTGGNTDVTTLSLKNVLKYRFTERFQGTWKLGIVYGRSDGETNAESYMTEFRGDYDVSERMYWLGYGNWMRDTFSGIDSRYSVGFGPGYRFLAGPKHRLEGEAGLSYTKDDYDDGGGKDYFGGRLFAKYEYAFTEKNRFSQSLEWLLDFSEFEDWDLNSETAVTAALNSYLALKGSYAVKYANRPVDDRETTDTILSVALQLNF